MAEVAALGNVSWSRTDMLDHLADFAEVYAKRPIKDNSGGMRSAHLFASWFALKMLQPKTIVESGLWWGQGTWFFEQACPDAELHCIDINLEQIKYRSSHARYYQQDFSTIDWSQLSRDETVLFFDDHQNAYERAKTAKWFGFKHLIFEDNYPSQVGDVYSLKKVFAHAGFDPAMVGRNSAKTLKSQLKSIGQSTLSSVSSLMHIPTPSLSAILPNQVDAIYLRQNLEIYYEFPPIFQVGYTRWNDPWDEQYPTPAPLLTTISEPHQQVFFDEALDYTWLCYAKLG